MLRTKSWLSSISRNLQKSDGLAIIIYSGKNFNNLKMSAIKWSARGRLDSSIAETFI